MAMALYEPGLGYYSRDSRKFGSLPSSGSDFVTAPELSPLFGRALARQVAQALTAAGSGAVWEFGAGSGALAAQLLESLGEAVRVTPSSSCRARCASGSASGWRRSAIGCAGGCAAWHARWCARRQRSA